MGGFLGVISIVLLLSSIIRVNGLAKLSRHGLEGRGAIFGNLFLKGDNDPSAIKNLLCEGYMEGDEYNHHHMELGEEYQENLYPCYFF